MIKLFSIYVVIELGNLFSETTYFYRTDTIKQGVSKKLKIDQLQCRHQRMKEKRKYNIGERDRESP